LIEQYELEVQQEDKTWKTQVFYGQLEEILVCKLPKDKFWNFMSGKSRLLAVIEFLSILKGLTLLHSLTF
jgi:hypothetical protein